MLYIATMSFFSTKFNAIKTKKMISRYNLGSTMSQKRKCPIHPKYKGKKQPKYSSNKGCICVQIYLLFHNKPRVFPIFTKIIKDKSKYTRKNKHKKEDQ